MNTNKLKKFAQDTRRKLLKQVNGKLEYVLNTDSSELRGKAQTVKELKKELESLGREALVDKVAYTWFNRFVALRYMDARGYQPLEMSILTPQEGQVSPQILQEAMAGHISADLKVNHQQLMDILDGLRSSSNPENEAYRLLLVASCNHLNSIFPFLFESIDDYSELLLPDDLTSEFSIVQDVVDGMTEEDCQQVEILGWLYQFYISEKKDELINAKKKYKPEEIAPVTQLFTPKWLVKFMVDNSLGQYWKEVNPKTQLTDELEFYISPQNPELIPNRNKVSLEEITFFDPCLGSGHILTYAFDLFYKMYEEEGYAPSQIPELILTKNLYGIDIDERAAQIAGFALMMKGREKARRFFNKEITPNITHFVNIDSHPKLQNAKVLGSLINVTQKDVDELPDETDTLFAEQNKKAKKQAKLLANKYDLIVTNPPYLNSTYMEDTLKDYVTKNYSETKSDLFACFIVKVTELTKQDGIIGYICPYVWMSISSYEYMRKYIIKNLTITSLVQLEYNAFGPATVPISAFTIRKNSIANYLGSYISLSDFKGVENQEPRTLEAIQNRNSEWFYVADQKNFRKISGIPIAYWEGDKTFEIFEKGKELSELATSFQGMILGNNNKFLRYWYEPKNSCLELNPENSVTNNFRIKNWVPYNKGGKYRKWYGNQKFIANWKNQGKDFTRSRHTFEEFFFQEYFSWSYLTSSNIATRYYPPGFIWDVHGSGAFPYKNDDLYYLLSLVSSKVGAKLLRVLNSSMTFQVENMLDVPVHFTSNKLKSNVIDIAKKNIYLTKIDWDSQEFSWDFQQNELIRFKKEGGIETLEEATEVYKQYWINQFFKLHQNEEELNRQFIEIYGLEDELTPEVPFEEITILQDELDSKKLKKKDSELRRQKSEGRNPELPFKDKEVFSQFLSYAVGCMLGRYSLDKEGLILANQGETLEDYLRVVTGDWWFVNSERKWEIDKNKNAYEHYTQLQRSDHLAGGDSPDQANLYDDEDDAKGRSVRANEPNKTGSSEHTQQHRRGTGEGNQRVQILSEDSERFSGRAGHSTNSGSGTGNASEGNDTENTGRFGSSGKTDQQFNQQTQLNRQSPTTEHQPPITFLPDDDNIIPVLDDEWFEDDIVFRFHEFLKASFGEANFQQNLSFVEEMLGYDIRKYFDRYFYKDHYKRYNKRPIYWKFASPKGHFSVLIYMHRYTSDTLNNILNNYLREFVNKLKTRKEQMEHLENTGSASEKAQASKEIDKLNAMIADCQTYEREILFPLASERIEMDLDDGVLVNYNLFGNAVEEIKSINDKAKKKKVKEFDWIDGGRIL